MIGGRAAAMPRQFGKVDSSERWSCDKCRRKHDPEVACPPVGVWLSSRLPVRSSTHAVWLKRAMPDGQWPVDQRMPRDDSFSWWVRSACGHPGGVRQWAFHEERYADMYEQVFRDDPCRWSRCQDRKRREEKR